VEKSVTRNGVLSSISLSLKSLDWSHSGFFQWSQEHLKPNDVIPPSGESPNDGYSIAGPGYGYLYMFLAFSRSEMLLQETRIHQTSHLIWCPIIQRLTGSILSSQFS